jgi:menaquinone-dependent protoporphyrinogen oxidase
MPVLVAYASKHGPAQGIAVRIAAVLPASGLKVDLAAAEDVGDPAGYDAFVIGSAVYASGWMAPASEFIGHDGALLTDRPGWLFSVGPAGRRIPLPATLPPVMAALGDSIGAQDHHVSRGAIDAGNPRGGEHLIRLFLPPGRLPGLAGHRGLGHRHRQRAAPDPATARALKAGRARSRPLLEGL